MRTATRFAISLILASSLLCLTHPRAGEAGSLEPPETAFDSSGNSPAATMVTLNEIYQRVELAIELQNSQIPAPIAKTGQLQGYTPGDDGNLQKGVAWPVQRFTDNGDGAVLDNLTKLVWDKNANRFDRMPWADAVSSCRNLAANGQDLKDGSQSGDWRLPNVNEFQSIVDYSQHLPCLPAGHPFVNVGNKYWTSTPTNRPDYPDNDAWWIWLSHGETHIEGKAEARSPWCIRSRP